MYSVFVNTEARTLSAGYYGIKTKTYNGFERCMYGCLVWPNLGQAHHNVPHSRQAKKRMHEGLLELGRRVPFFGSQREKSMPAKWSHSPKTYSDGKKPSPVLFLLPSNWVNDYATEYSQMQK